MSSEHHAAESITRCSRGPKRGWPLCVGILGIGLALRAWLTTSLSLTKDEAAYWAWSHDLDPAYALLPLVSIRASCSLWGSHEWAVRLPFLLAATGAAGLFWAFCREVGLSSRCTGAALALFSCNAWFHFIGSQAHPDAFLAFFWVGALWALARSRRRNGERSDLWLPLGAVLSGAAALSKYTGFLLWPAIAVSTLLTGARTRRAFGRLLAATGIWLLVTLPALFAIIAQDGHWIGVASRLSDVGPRVPVAARLMLVPLAPFLALFAPTFAVYLVGLWSTLVRPRATRAPWGWIGVLTALPVVALGARGSIKGNWMLPALWGTLPRGTAQFMRTRRGRRVLLALMSIGVVGLLMVHAALLDPDGAVEGVGRIAAVRWLEKTYEATISREELLHASSRTWRDRAYEFHAGRVCADSITARTAAYAPGALVMSNLYEVVYPTEFYGGIPALLVQDTRFRRMPEYVSRGADAPERVLYVTLPDAHLPEPLFSWYGYLEREGRLTVPIGRYGERSYDVWRCGPAGE